MNLITYIENEFELNQFLEIAGDKSQSEIIVSCHLISRFSKTTKEELLTLAALAKKNRLKVVLEWDALNQEKKFQQASEFVSKLPLHDFDAIRLQDPGAVHFIKTNYPWLKIQLILENGNHNFAGLTKWSDYLGEQCERLILSNELSKTHLALYASQLKKPLEVLGFGRILLFYSPRMLLSPLEKSEMQKQYIEASGTSEESPHSGFPLIENQHGTFMFNVKDLYLLDHLTELAEIGVHHVRIDLRFDHTQKYFADIIQLFEGKKKESDLEIKKNHPRPFIKGFYNINKTDVLFTKLKNTRTQRNDQNYIGEIVDVEKESQLALMIKSETPLESKNTHVKMITPDGKEKILKLTWMKSSTGEFLEIARKDDLILIPFYRGVTVKTQVYLNPNT